MDSGKVVYTKAENLSIVEAPPQEEVPVEKVFACVMDQGPLPEHLWEDSDTSSIPRVRWGHELYDRLVRSKSSVMARVWARWAQRADKLADEHIRKNFDAVIAERLQDAASRTPSGDLEVVLAVCGSDCADHEATMSHAHRLVREQFPTACLAQVGPEDFKSVAITTKRVCEQLTRGTAARESRFVTDLHEGEAEDAEWWPDGGDAQTSCVGLLDFVDWHRRQGSKAGIAVLLVERVEATPNGVLLDFLRGFGRACGVYKIPAIVIFGLKALPKERRHLFGRGRETFIVLSKAVRLFDAQMVCNGLLEDIALDHQSLPLSPALLQWARKEFLYYHRSVHDTLRALAAVCMEHSKGCYLVPSGSLGIEGSGEEFSEAQRPELVQHFFRWFQQAGDVVKERLQRLWRGACDVEPPSASAAAEVAADVALWHRRCCASLPTFDVLLCAADPTSRVELRLRRFTHLSSLLWPRTVGEDTDEATVVSKQQKDLTGLLSRILNKIFETGSGFDNLQRLQRLQKLHRELVQASSVLDPPLRGLLGELESLLGDEVALADGLRKWCETLSSECWRPLSGVQRCFFIEVAAGEDLKDRAVLHLSGRKASTVEAVLGPMASGRRPPSLGGTEDLTLLWRFVQGSMGKRIPMAQLWRAFAEHAEQTRENSLPSVPLRRRFAIALGSLQIMGLQVPRTAAGKAGAKDAGMRPSKRYFGRLWGGSKKPSPTWMPRGEDAVVAEKLFAVGASEGGESQRPQPHELAQRPKVDLKQGPAWTLTLRAKLWANQGSTKRRAQPPPATADATNTPQRRITTGKKQRTRMFMG